MQGGRPVGRKTSWLLTVAQHPTSRFARVHNPHGRQQTVFQVVVQTGRTQDLMGSQGQTRVVASLLRLILHIKTPLALRLLITSLHPPANLSIST